MLALKNVSTVRIEQNQHWPGNRHGFSHSVAGPNQNSAHLASAAHRSSSIFSHAHVGHFLSSFCDCSQLSTSVALCIGSICSHELANTQPLFNNFWHSALLWWLENVILQDFAIAMTYMAFVNMGVAFEICIRIIEVSDNWGSDNRACTVLSWRKKG